MDQLKVFGKVLVKYHFWILTVLVLLASLGSFWVSRQSLDEQVSQRINAVEGKYKSVSTLAREAPTHPNDLSDVELKKAVGVLTSDVKAAWESQYNRQRGILVWPEAVGTAQTLKKLDSFRPIEFFLEFSNPVKNDPLSLTEREVYRDYVKNVFPELAKIVGATWTAVLSSSAGGGGFGGGQLGPSGGAVYGPPPGMMPNAGNLKVVVPLVTWEEGSQKTLQSEIIPWYDPTTPPSTLEICYTQEDLWILDGILRVIKRTNGNARENFQAPIKQIEWIRLGKTARADAGNVFGAVGMSQTASGPPPTGGGGPMYGPGGMMASKADPADGRYVHSDYKPVSSSKLRSAMKSSEPTDALFAVAKRIPVQFRLKMDPTKVSTLISECGNNDLLIEVKQVRVNGEASAPGGRGMMGGGGPGGPPPGSGGPPPGFGGPPGGGAMSMGGPFGINSDPIGSGDTPIEVYGIVYLFNPVDIQKLGLDKVTSETALDETSDGSAVANKAAASKDVTGKPATEPITPTAGVDTTKTTPATALPTTAPPATVRPSGGDVQPAQPEGTAGANVPGAASEPVAPGSAVPPAS